MRRPARALPAPKAPDPSRAFALSRCVPGTSRLAYSPVLPAQSGSQRFRRGKGTLIGSEVFGIFFEWIMFRMINPAIHNIYIFHTIINYNMCIKISVSHPNRDIFRKKRTDPQSSIKDFSHIAFT